VPHLQTYLAQSQRATLASTSLATANRERASSCILEMDLTLEQMAPLLAENGDLRNARLAASERFLKTSGNGR
jgi:hypothetical protein